MGTSKLAFGGTLEELQTIVTSCGCTGTWKANGNGHQFRASDDAILNWWPTKGTVTLQGNAAASKRLEGLIQPYLAGAHASVAPANTADPVTGSWRLPSSAPPAVASAAHQIFVVHGHDKTARDELELMIHRLDLEPYILINSNTAGKTIIEALEAKIGKNHESDFGIVLFTADDMGYSKATPDKQEHRARQNVVLETGMLLASLTRRRTAIIVKGHVTLPSDLQGVIELRYNDHIKEVVPQLCAHLAEVGIHIDQKLMSKAQG